MKKKIVSLWLAIISALSLGLSACGTTTTETASSGNEIIQSGEGLDLAPDYSDSNLQYDFYGYTAASGGTWNIDGVEYSAGEDFRTVERLQEYKDVGMTIFFPQDQGGCSDNYEASDAKKMLDLALEAGMDKVILQDGRIQILSKSDGSLIGEGKKFASEEELDATIASYMKDYTQHEAFYGVMLGDEPFYNMAEAYGQVYNSIRRIHPDCFIQYNLNPITAGVGINKNGMRNIDIRFPQLEEGDEGYGENLDEDTEIILRYKKYLRMFMDATGADFLQYDQYPMRHAEKLDEYFILGFQVATEIAKEYDAKFYFVSQTYGQTDGVANPRKLKQEDLYWINNMTIGFGAKMISYFTYWTKRDNNAEHFVDGQSFITWHGERTKIYDWMKQIMAEEQKFAPTILNFDYNTSKVYVQTPTVFNSAHAVKKYETADFTALKNVEINKETALVTELYDEDQKYYMYMVQNVVDSINKGSKAFQTTTLTFDSQYKYAAVYVKGERTLKKLDNGKLTLKHRAGEASYVIPY